MKDNTIDAFFALVKAGLWEAEAEWEYVPNAETRAAIEECENGAELETLDIANFKDYVKSL